ILALGVGRDVHGARQNNSQADDRHGRVPSQVPDLEYFTEVHSHRLSPWLRGPQSNLRAAVPLPVNGRRTQIFHEKSGPPKGHARPSFTDARQPLVPLASEAWR